MHTAFPRRHFIKGIGTAAAALPWANQLFAATGSFDAGAVDGMAPGKMLESYLQGQAFRALDERKTRYEALKTPEQIQEYQKQLRAFFIRQLGGFPERTPLNARVTGKLDGDGYKLEKVIYESQPGFWVTANLYLPLSKGPYPGVIFSCGHSANGKGIETYQLACVLLARNGIAVLSYDPIGQGERCHYLKADNKPATGATDEHQMIGMRCRLTGTDLAGMLIWDGMRGIDYLQSRPEIIPDKIGATGNSGGGTLTSYLMSLDDRIVCAAPSCYLTGFRRLLETIGPQDFEQNIFGQLGGGLDHADYVLMRAPKPTLMCVATHDFFDITGAWDIFRQAKRIYTRLERPEAISLVEADEKHGFSIRLREGMVRWMRRWLLGIDAPLREMPVKLPKEEDLLCTPSGQVVREKGALSVFELLGAREKRFRPRKPKAETVRSLTGIRSFDALPELKVEKKGTGQWDGRAAESIVVQLEPKLWVPAVHVPAAAGSSDSPVLYLPDPGKGAPPNDLIRRTAGGARLLIADLPGLGETKCVPGSGDSKSSGPDRKAAQTAFLLGRSIVAIRAEAILQCVRYLDSRSGVKLICGANTAVAALHAVALQPGRFSSVTFPSKFMPWAEVIVQADARLAFIDAVPNALTVYDLPDLLAMIPAGKNQSEA